MGFEVLQDDLKELLTLRQVCELFPGPRRPSISTVRRWATRGLAGVVLPTVLLLGTKYTSRRALVAFLLKVSEQR